MSVNDASVESALAAMRQRYVETSRGTIATLDLVGEGLNGAPDSDDLLTLLRRELHRVHGTAGSLGFEEASKLAGAMEGLVRKWHDDPSLDRARRSAIVLNFSGALNRAISASGDDNAPHDKRLVLLGLSDALGDRLVAEAMHRGVAVERRMELGASNPPWAIVATEEAFASAPASAKTGTQCIVLRDSSSSRGALPDGVHALDVDASAAEIIEALGIADNAAERTVRGAVLIVDDDPMMLMLLGSLAESEGYSVVKASGAESFREQLRSGEPAMLVLDIELDGASGIELLREMRSERRHAALPVMMLSGRSDSDARTESFAAGADDYMLKPVVPAEFQQRLERLAELRRERQESTGIDPDTGLPSAARLLDDIDARLSSRDDVEWSVGVIRPSDVGMSADEMVRLARELTDASGVAGLMEGSGLAFALPLAPSRASEVVRAAIPDGDANAWHAGLVSTRAMPGERARALIAAATDAAVAARAASATVRVWDMADKHIAPDVIVVEDDPTLREMLAFALDAHGLVHRAYASGPEALDALLALPPSDRSTIVLLDIDLPGMDGHSLHERLRVERPGAFHVVFISLHTSEADQLRALKGGALDYLVKPISLRVLIAKLDVWRERLRAG